jgi:hypothetical protein
MTSEKDMRVAAYSGVQGLYNGFSRPLCTNFGHTLTFCLRDYHYGQLSEISHVFMSDEGE